MKRGGFKPRYERRPERQMDDYTPKPRAVAVAVSDGKARMVVQVPKAEKARPGKRAPTKAEKEWMDAITVIGCIACLIDGYPGTPGAVHHLLRGGQRIGHLHSICLCDPGHHQGGQGVGKISRHPWKARFEERYGSEESLLERTKLMVIGTSTRMTSHHEAGDERLHGNSHCTHEQLPTV